MNTFLKWLEWGFRIIQSQERALTPGLLLIKWALWEKLGTERAPSGHAVVKPCHFPGPLLHSQGAKPFNPWRKSRKCFCPPPVPEPRRIATAFAGGTKAKSICHEEGTGKQPLGPEPCTSTEIAHHWGRAGASLPPRTCSPSYKVELGWHLWVGIQGHWETTTPEGLPETETSPRGQRTLPHCHHALHPE